MLISRRINIFVRNEDLALIYKPVAWMKTTNI